MDEEKGAPLGLAMVLTTVAPALEPGVWRDALERFGLTLVGEVEASGVTLSATLESGAILTVGLMPGPIPGDELANYTDSEVLWPGAAQAIAAHVGHALVVQQGGEADLQARIEHTIAVVATAMAMEAPGIYWGQVPQVSSTQVALEVLVGSLNEGELPVPLWIAISAGRMPDGRWAALTRGLPAFDHLDLWLTSAEQELQDLMEQAMSIAAYVVGTGAVLEAGQTLGADEVDRHLIQATVSPDGEDVPMLRIDYP